MGETERWCEVWGEERIPTVNFEFGSWGFGVLAWLGLGVENGGICAQKFSNCFYSHIPDSKLAPVQSNDQLCRLITFAQSSASLAKWMHQKQTTKKKLQSHTFIDTRIATILTSHSLHNNSSSHKHSNTRLPHYFIFLTYFFFFHFLLVALPATHQHSLKLIREFVLFLGSPKAHC